MSESERPTPTVLTDLTIGLPERPGGLADAGEAAGRAGINIEGICGVMCGTQGNDHILVDDAAAARAALTAAGIVVRAERQVLVVACENRPGEIGRVCRRIADAGISIDLVYLAAGDRLVLGVDDMDRALLAM